jgi:subtilisin-like proprotein convertase family protein
MTNDYRPPGGIMFIRIVMLMLIVTLALPVATLTRPAETRHSPWGELAVEAKGKNHKQKGKKPRSKTITRTVRQPVTQTFTSSGPITIPQGAPGTTKGPATPYPSAIEVSGLTNGTITDVNLILDDVTHSYLSDLDILLSTSAGSRALVMSDVGALVGATDVDLTLDDEAGASLPNDRLSSGTFRPTDLGLIADTFAAPAPAPNGIVALSTFDGADPNGTWQLWVVDDRDDDVGDIASWALQITAEVDTGTVTERIPVTKAKKHKKHKKRR